MGCCHRGRCGKPEHKPWGLSGRPRAEAQDRLQRRLAELVAAFGATREQAGAGPAEVAERLARGEVLVELVLFTIRTIPTADISM